jgi:hypothetical protein
MNDTPIFASVEQDLEVTYDELAAGPGVAAAATPST